MTLNLQTYSPDAVLRPGPKNRPARSPLIHTLPAKQLKPAQIFQRCPWKNKGVLLDGTMGGWLDGRFSLIAGAPFGLFRSKGQCARFDLLHQGKNKSFYSHQEPLTALQTWLNKFKLEGSRDGNEHIPFLHGGVVGFFSYEMAQHFEKLSAPGEADSDFPDIYLLFLNLFILCDHQKDTLHIIYNPMPDIQLGAEEKQAISEGLEKIDAVENYIFGGASIKNEAAQWSRLDLKMDCTPEHYIALVHRVKDYILKGDIFQANLSHRFTSASAIASLFGIYQDLCRLNPSPFAAYLELGDIQIASDSPERLVRVTNHRDGAIVETRPIAGTKPRGKNPAEDDSLIRSLYGSEKERAEHLMLVDLERNDLGKICEYGSVRVDAMMALERYSHVSHLVSNIRGQLRPGLSPLDVLRAVFPGGTITGTPKIRCMEIITELERRARGIYTGAIGYIAFDGEMDLNIAIRTCVQHKGQLSFQVGAGIVADSDPEMEYQETLHKAAALIEVLKSSDQSSVLQ